MKTRYRCQSSIVRASMCLLLFSVPTLADDFDSHDQTLADIAELIAIIPPSYECQITHHSVTPVNVSSGVSYVVKAAASGERCDEALDRLNYLGRSKQWSFSFVDERPKSKLPSDRQDDGKNQDLIHEVDPFLPLLP